mgnify:CR=1 FL=1
MAIPTTGAIFIAAILIECYSRYVRALISQRATRYEPVNQMGETFVTITEGTSGGEILFGETELDSRTRYIPPTMNTFHGISRSA